MLMGNHNVNIKYQRKKSALFQCWLAHLHFVFSSVH